VKIKRWYYYVFYKFYKLGELSPSIYSSDYVAMVCMLWFEIVFLSTLKIYYREFINPNDDFILSSPQTIITVSILILIKYILFIQGTEWKKYIKEFKHLPEDKRDKGTVIVGGIILFIITSLIVAAKLTPGGKH
jgi:hypothetical protein